MSELDFYKDAVGDLIDMLSEACTELEANGLYPSRRLQDWWLNQKRVRLMRGPSDTTTPT